jgi:hypothetical protein
MSATAYDLQASMSGVERMKLPQRQASKAKAPLKVREATIELCGNPLLR